jgi:hypothetical protein
MASEPTNPAWATPRGMLKNVMAAIIGTTMK